MNLREILDQMDNRTLFLNLAITQGGLFILGVLLYIFFLRPVLPLSDLFHVQHFLVALMWGLLFALIVVLLDLLLMRFLSKDYFDDGGVNERLFRDVNALQIFLIALGVAFVEEWLFRGVLQNIIGLFWTSLLFALIHYRYLQKWIYGTLIVLLSFGLGYLYEWSGSLWSVIAAHFWIDFSLGLLIRYRWFSFLKD